LSSILNDASACRRQTSHASTNIQVTTFELCATFFPSNRPFKLRFVATFLCLDAPFLISRFDIQFGIAVQNILGIGTNQYGQLGNGVKPFASSPVPFDATGVLQNERIKLIAGGLNHAVALTESGA
jgi:hypothetical protein